MNTQNTITAPITREAWLNEASSLILSDILLPLSKTVAPPFRVSVGWPTGSRGGSKQGVIGVCHPRSHSADGHNEIWITPIIDDSLEVLEVLVHELIHAIDDCQSGHKGNFAMLARKSGLEGKLTATYAGDALKTILLGYIETIGSIPHAALDYSLRKKQGTRMIKVSCQSEGCGFAFRTTAKWLGEFTNNNCNCCGDDSLKVEGA